MNGPISMQPLEGAQTIDYFLEILKTGGAADADFNISQLQNGHFSAVVPQGVSPRRVERFSDGGLLETTEPAHVIGNASVHAVPTALSAISAIMAKRIRRCADPVLWVHEPTLLEEEIKNSQVRCQTIDGQLYLVYENAPRTEPRLAEVIRYSTLSWHFLAFLTNDVHQVRSVSDLVRQAQTILVGAYDGESMLLWDRTQSC